MANFIKEEYYPINGNGFEYLGVHYNCHFAIKSDIEMIIREAETSHKDTFEELYDKDSLRPDKVKLFTIDSSYVPIYGMITYIIDNKKRELQQARLRQLLSHTRFLFRTTSVPREYLLVINLTKLN